MKHAFYKHSKYAVQFTTRVLARGTVYPASCPLNWYIHKPSGKLFCDFYKGPLFWLNEKEFYDWLIQYGCNETEALRWSQWEKPAPLPVLPPPPLPPPRDPFLDLSTKKLPPLPPPLPKPLPPPPVPVPRAMPLPPPPLPATKVYFPPPPPPPKTNH